ncbi:MAG: AI-2E family transporter [bacterium]
MRMDHAKPRVTRFEISPATMIHIILTVAGIWLLIRLWPVFLVLIVALLIVGTLTIPALVAQASEMVGQEPAFRARLADHLALSNLTAPFADWLRNLKYDAPASVVSATAFALSLRVFTSAAYAASAIFLALYIRGQLITCLFIAVFSFILLVACGVPHALALAVFAGMADVLPYLGALVAMVPMVLTALARGPVVVIVVLLVMFAYAEFESRVLVPRVFGQTMRLPSSVVLFALLAGGTLMGLLGALLALPVAATVMMLIEELRVELPGQQEQVADVAQRVGDERAEIEYERRTEGVPAEQAAAIAVKMSADRRKAGN